MTTDSPEPTGTFEEFEGRRWYRIDHYDSMAPFLMSLVSSSDHWMYVSSSGSLTAGRGTADNSLFAYRTDDLLHRFGGLTGPYTGIRVDSGSGSTLWEPFSDRESGPQVTRSLLKSVEGDAVIFEEHNARIRATFSYRLTTSDRFGFVKTSTLRFWDDRPIQVELLDGFLDIMPPNVVLGLVQTSSTLVVPTVGMRSLVTCPLPSSPWRRGSPTGPSRGNRSRQPLRGPRGSKELALSSRRAPSPISSTIGRSIRRPFSREPGRISSSTTASESKGSPWCGRSPLTSGNHTSPSRNADPPSRKTS